VALRATGLAFYVSTGAQASELLSATAGGTATHLSRESALDLSTRPPFTLPNPGTRAERREWDTRSVKVIMR
jgi:hypothetical protein